MSDNIQAGKEKEIEKTEITKKTDRLVRITRREGEVVVSSPNEKDSLMSIVEHADKLANKHLGPERDRMVR